MTRDNKDKIQALIVTPDIHRIGGVANHYLGLSEYWKKKVVYQYYGKRMGLPALLLFPYDILRFIYALIFSKIDVVIINPSLRRYQIFRDAIYLLLARLFNVNVITFFHGWDYVLSKKIEANPQVFNWVFNKSLFIYVLYSEFKSQLISIGVKAPVLLTSTKVDDEYLKSFDIYSRKGKINNILFLARIELYKGIYEALKTFEVLSDSNNSLQLTIVGSGTELSNVKMYIAKNKIKNVTLKGALSGDKLINEFKRADVYLFPSYAEGMPTSVLEAMAFGLPIISSPVGGLNDFFRNGKMGFLIDGYLPIDFANAINELIINPELTREISCFNHEFAINNFLASSVAKKIESDIDQFVNNDKAETDHK